MKGNKKVFIRFSCLGLLIFLSSQAYAAGYKLEFQSASTLADAGEAAVVEDAGTNWYNSAGLVLLPQQVVFSGIDVYAPSRFRGTVIAPSVFGPAFSFVGSGRASSHTNTFLPAYHYSLPFRDCWAIGFSMVPAWGFREYYGGGAFTRYDLVRVYTKTIDLSPSIAYSLSPQLSIGAGADFHYFAAQSKAHVRTQGPRFLGGTIGDSITRFSGERWGFGGHAGILWQVNEATRVGLNYRSKLMTDLKGHSDFSLGGGPPVFEEDHFRLPIPLPATTSLSIYRDINPCWALMGTVAWDQWHMLRNYHARNFIQPRSPANPTGIIPSVNQPQRMHDTVDLSIGTHYRWNDRLLIRGSFKYEDTPTRSRYRDITFPDGKKYGLQIGTRYQFNQKLAFDFIYGHAFVQKVRIHNVNPLSHATANGHSRSHIDILGGQVVWNI